MDQTGIYSFVYASWWQEYKKSYKSINSHNILILHMQYYWASMSKPHHTIVMDVCLYVCMYICMYVPNMYIRTTMTTTSVQKVGK